jgi:two-component system sensor histidine kinase ArlS
LMRRIDASTSIALKDKTIQVYDYLDKRIYWYSDNAGDTVVIDSGILDDARVEGDLYFSKNNKDMVVHHFIDEGNRLVIVAAAYDEEGKNNLSRLKLILWISFAGGILISLAGGYIFSARLLLPIRNITDDVKEISAQNLARRIKTGDVDDEWHYLSVTLNKLLNRLQESFELQGRFISNASHELSTPLTAISSQLEVALQREREVKEYQAIMQSIYQDVRHLTQLTRALLEFAKASGKSGRLDINLVRVDEIILGLPGYMKRINAAYSVVLHFEGLPADEKELLVAANEELLHSAISNVVSNACKFSPDHLADITLRVKEDHIVIQVQDHGKGIPTDELEKIFQPFYRADESRTEPGFGLGLALSDRIIKLHKGKITVSSSSPKGTVFTITLPVASQAERGV